MKIRMTALIAAIAVVLSACSDNNSTTPTPTAKNYYPLTVGSSWNYEYVEIDSLGGAQGSPQQYSWTASRVVDTLGKTKVTVLTSSQGGNSPQIVEGSMLSIFEIPFSFPVASVQIPARWNKTADFTANAQWSVFDTTLAGVQDTLNAGGIEIPMTISGTVSVAAKNIGAETITVKGQTYANCMKIVRTISTTLTASGSVSGFPLNVPLTSTVTVTDWCADGVGLVKSIATPLVPKADLTNIPEIFKSDVSNAVNQLIRPGSRTELTTSSIVK